LSRAAPKIAVMKTMAIAQRAAGKACMRNDFVGAIKLASSLLTLTAC